jgi:ribosomal protein S18 acetylase RimI-like enzyme
MALACDRQVGARHMVEVKTPGSSHTEGARPAAARRLRLLYVRGSGNERDLAIVQQLRRVTRDVLVTSSAAPASLADQIARAAADGAVHALVTSPSIGEGDALELIRALRRTEEPLAILPVVNDAHRGTRSVAAGADAALIVADGVVTNPGEIARCVEHRQRVTARAAWVRGLFPTVVAASRRALVELETLQERLAAPQAVGPITVQVVRQVDEALLEAAQRLIPQHRVPAPGPWELEQIVRHPGTTLLVARDGQVIVGMLMLVVVRGPVGIRAWIDDLIIDEAARGCGVGTLLTQEAVSVAERCGARSVQLSCSSSKPGPNRAYQRLGFERRERTLYRYRMSG